MFQYVCSWRPQGLGLLGPLLWALESLNCGLVGKWWELWMVEFVLPECAVRVRSNINQAVSGSDKLQVQAQLRF